MAVEDELTIGEAARLAGVPASTLRYWETAGLLKAPRRVGGKRRYDREGLQQIEMVAVAKRAGFTLAEIRVILSGVSRRTPPSVVWRRLASNKLPEVEQTLVEAQAMKRILEAGLRCECLSLEDCLSGTPCG
ncbi:MAG TPA: MerR family transcriptional regulator [Solirubrobacterales bacterium]|nr:MerR family transcriptional regulator [Solirubrobacterales bacterium]